MNSYKFLRLRFDDACKYQITEMSTNDLSCLDAVKSRSRTLSSRLRENTEETLTTRDCSTRHTTRPTLFPIEVIDENVIQHQVKIHYTGYSNKYDEWIRKSQIQYKPVLEPEESVDLQSHNFATLACCIKQKLIPSRKTEDPKVRIQIPFVESSFNLLKRKGVLLDIRINGHQTYGIKDYNDLDEVLGAQWHIRVVNVNGDFSCALLRTVQFYALQPKPILDFSINTSLPESLLQANADLAFVPYFTPQQPAIVFQFVKKDGGKRKLIDLLNEGPDSI